MHTARSVDRGRTKVPSFGDLVGGSLVMRRVFSLLERAAGSRGTVLLLGETGTGKGAAAEAVHAASARSAGPFVVVDCASIPASLLESELFGHERGAFSGAVAAREGAFEAAHGGTLFLDEIGELPLDMQPKILRALERREVKRVGSNRYVPIDVRFVAATHKDLRAEVDGGRFRLDLFFRLSVIEVALPALRDHVDDLPALVEQLLAGIDDGQSLRKSALDPSFIADLAALPWPGNVRELRNYLERFVALGAPPRLPTWGPGEAQGVDITVPLKAAREACIARFERAYLAKMLEANGGNVPAAARAAGIDRVHCHRLVVRHGLR